MKNFLCIFLCLMCMPWIVVAEDPALEEFDRQVSELLDSGYTQYELMRRISDADRVSDTGTDSDTGDEDQSSRTTPRPARINYVSGDETSQQESSSDGASLSDAFAAIAELAYEEAAAAGVTPEPKPIPTANANPFTDITIEDFQIVEVIFGEGIQATIENHLPYTLDAVDIIVYYENVYGERLGIIGPPQSFAYMFSEPIKPHSTYSMEDTGNYWNFTDMLNAPVRACVAVSRYHVKGGDTVVIPEDEYLWTYWDI